MKKSLNELEKKQYNYLIKVLSSAVNLTPAPVPYEGIIWENILRYAKNCGVSAMFANTVLSLPQEYLPSKEVQSELRQIQAGELLIDANLTYEIEILLKNFDKYGIKNVPLKGYFMKQEYPRSDYRSVSDFDILFDVNQLNQVKKAFSELGYKFVHYDDTQYHFSKKPFMYVEMHKSLTHEYEIYNPYMENQLENSYKRNGYEFSYAMSKEDHYLYMLIHSSNHFRIGGIGIRTLLDTYLYYKRYCSEFDFNYLNNKLRLFKLEKYENRLRQIAYNWFSKPEPLTEFDDIETYILLSTTLGRLDVCVLIESQSRIENGIKTGKKKSKLSYLRSSIFPPKSIMVFDYRYLEKFPFLLPVSWIHMWFTRIFVCRNVSVKRGLKNRLSYTGDDVKYIKKLFNDVGFTNLGLRE